LPMKIDGEWTHVDIRLIKRHSRSKKAKEQGRFSVVMNVSPRIAGDITISMDYAVKKSLNARLAFEKNSSKVWFNRYRDELTASLSRLGIPAVQVALESVKAPLDAPVDKAAIRTPRPSGEASRIDISV